MPTFNENSGVGVYTISLNPFTLNGVVVSTFVGPSSFVLDVVDPCLSTTLDWASEMIDKTFSVSQLDSLGANLFVT